MELETLRSSECGVRRPAHSAAESVIEALRPLSTLAHRASARGAGFSAARFCTDRRVA